MSFEPDSESYEERVVNSLENIEKLLKDVTDLLKFIANIETEGLGD